VQAVQSVPGSVAVHAGGGGRKKRAARQSQQRNKCQVAL